MVADGYWGKRIIWVEGMATGRLLTLQCVSPHSFASRGTSWIQGIILKLKKEYRKLGVGHVREDHGRIGGGRG